MVFPLAIALATTTTSGVMALRKLLCHDDKGKPSASEHDRENSSTASTCTSNHDSEKEDEVASCEEENEIVQEPVPLPEPSCIVVRSEGETAENEAEFELWVETDLDAGWCLEDDRIAPNKDWQRGCSTSTLRRSWAEFEMLAKVKDHRSSQPIEALEELGLSREAPVSNSNVGAAFRRLARERHPDKGGSMEAFTTLVEARRAAQQAF